MAMFNEDKNLKSGGCADEIAALIRDDLSPKMIQEQLENYHNSDIAKSMEQLDRLGRMRLIRSIEPDKLAGIFKYVEPQEAAAFLKDIDTAELFSFWKRLTRMLRRTFCGNCPAATGQR